MMKTNINKLTMIGTRYQLKGSPIIWEVISKGKVMLVQTHSSGNALGDVLDDDEYWPLEKWDKIEPKEANFTRLYNRLK